jgi:hypothetical protein
MAQHESQRARVCITNALTAMEGYEVTQWLTGACMSLLSNYSSAWKTRRPRKSIVNSED